MVKRVVILVNANLYETKRHYAKGFAEALKERGIQCRIVDTQGKALDVSEVDAICDFAPDFTCSFNSVCSLSSGKFLWDYIEIPHWTINLDPVVYVLNLRQSPYTILSCVDRFDVDLVKQDAGFENCFFFPHATEAQLEPQSEVPPLDLVMVGSCYDHEGLRETWPSRFSPELCKAMDDAVDIVLSDNCTPFMQAILRVLTEQAIDPADIDLAAVMFCVDYYLRGRDRYELIKAIKGAHIHLVGGVHSKTEHGAKGWKRYLKDFDNVTVQSPVSFAESLELLKKFKLCLNSVPSFKNGTHVRVFSSFAAGCLPVTNDNVYWRKFFEDGQDIVLYQHKNWDAVNERIEGLLGDEEKRLAMLNRGREKVMRDHTWNARVDTVLTEIPPILERIRSQ